MKELEILRRQIIKELEFLANESNEEHLNEAYNNVGKQWISQNRNWYKEMLNIIEGAEKNG